MDWQQMEDKWRRRWAEARQFEPDPDGRKKFFVSVAYPYPNSPQHIGHGRTYTLADVHARFMRMRGYNVLFPMGFHYTGPPILGMARRVQENDRELLENFRNLYKVPDDKVREFSEPVKIADYFHEEIKAGMIEMGYSIDWRREFTTIDPFYSRFIEWQFRKLREHGLVVQGTHPVGWCPRDQNPVSQHDTLGDVEPSFTEYTVVKFRQGRFVLPAATLRPETVFGVTNIWVNPAVAYETCRVDGEEWIVSPECAQKIGFLNKKVEKTGTVMGSDLVGKTAAVPGRNSEVPILPAAFVKSDNGTGIVMSVPAHAPFDYQALEDLRKEGPSGLRLEEIRPIPIIETDGYGEVPARDVVERLGIKSQHFFFIE